MTHHYPPATLQSGELCVMNIMDNLFRLRLNTNRATLLKVSRINELHWGHIFIPIQVTG